jgi:predicted lipoprotein
MKKLFACCLVLTACSDSETPPDARPILRDVADLVILPTYAELATSTADLSSGLEALCAAPDEAKLATAQEAWRAARAPLKRAEAFAFGPIEDLRVDSTIDFWPARPDTIDDALAATEPVTDALIDSSASATKGLPAIEYLLFDPGGDDAAAIDRLAENGGRNCDYLAALGRDVAEQAARVKEAWDPAGGNYRGKFVDAGAGSDTYPTLQAGVSVLVDNLIQGALLVEGTKLAKPLGKRDGGTPQPDAVEASFSHDGADEIVLTLDGIQAVYQSDQRGASLSERVRSSRPDLDTTILTQIDTCKATVTAISLPLEQAVVDQPAEVESAFACTKELARLLQVDLATLVGVTPTFSDNDGD